MKIKVVHVHYDLRKVSIIYYYYMQYYMQYCLKNSKELIITIITIIYWCVSGMRKSAITTECQTPHCTERMLFLHTSHFIYILIHILQVVWFVEPFLSHILTMFIHSFHYLVHKPDNLEVNKINLKSLISFMK